MRPGVMRTREAVADAALAAARLQETFGYDEIAVAVGIPLRRAMEIVQGWVAAGLAEVVREARGGMRKVFRLVGNGEVPPRPAGRSPEDNLWTAMRGLRSFTPTDLAAHATTEAVAVSADAARAYCRFLLAAGYLGVTRKAEPGRKREAIYRLIRNTGPKSPRERRVRAVLDPNTAALSLLAGEP
ncbi:MAG: hypothetical protein ACK4L4_19135 [Gemmobacter sp.]